MMLMMFYDYALHVLQILMHKMCFSLYFHYLKKDFGKLFRVKKQQQAKVKRNSAPNLKVF